VAEGHDKVLEETIHAKKTGDGKAFFETRLDDDGPSGNVKPDVM
jgi:hypothetical protein